ncbi:peptidoglycan recognition protein [Biomphalaria pfeifferi]|uniref:Peptidoglycan-recognition protein n=1 Tax=Biomphalaria pfeifferi TaxID=112525 RepID=A0AAD8B887_BIOPF|nr:peptidoglycan recognition protein [Biomphalaria pfeifferi]
MLALLSAIGCLLVSSVFGACPHVVTRAEWGARAATHVSHLVTPVQYAFIHHTAGADCHDRATCAAQVRLTQNYHMNGRNYSDIGYSFMIGGNGEVFEGRGWDHLGAHTLNYNSHGYGFCFIGTFTSHVPTSAAQQAAKDMIACGVQLGKLRSDYTLRGHRDVGATECPGNAFYPLIKTWPHY